MRFLYWWYVLPLRLRSLFRGRAADRDLDDELQYHLERQTELHVAQGMAPREARLAALRALGGVELHKEACRDRRRVALADTAIRDLRYGMRVLARSPVFTAVAILTLALGIGATAAIFHVVDLIALRTLPVAEPDRLAEVRAPNVGGFGIHGGPHAEITHPLWEQLRDDGTAFDRMFAWGSQAMPTDGGTSRFLYGLWVSGEFFDALGLRPWRGRLLGPADDVRGCGAGGVVVSHAFWQSRLGGQESVVGTRLTLFDQPFTIVGVTPPGFAGLDVGQVFDVAVPICAAALTGGDALERRDFFWLRVMGRLKSGWTLERASEHLRARSPGLLAATIPSGFGPELVDRYEAFRFEAIAAARGVSALREAHTTSLLLLLGLTGLVLLITCGNLATLMLARASAREREVAVRAAVGASRARLVSQLTIESLLVAAVGAALAVPVALASGRLLVALLETAAGSIELDLAADGRLLAFISIVALVTAVLFGVVPALRASMVRPMTAMRQASRGLTVDRQRARFQRVLVAGQVAVSLVLVTAALLFVRSFRNLATVETGLAIEDVAAVSFVDRDRPPASLAQQLAFHQRLVDEIAMIPGVVSASATTRVPLNSGSWAHFFTVPRSGGAEQKVSRFTYVGPGYFGTLRIPVRAGREFTRLDDAAAPRVAVVNESFVRHHLGGIEPVGATIRTVDEAGYPAATYQIVGVTGDTRYADLRDEPCWCDGADGMPPIAYVPLAQIASLQPWPAVLVRADAPVAALETAIAERVASLKPSLSATIVDLSSNVRARAAGDRMIAWLAGAFGAVAMALVTIGLYGIIAYLTSGRRNEIGVRLALGSTRAQIVMLVMRESALLLGAGLVVGVPLTLLAVRSGATYLYGIAPTDPATIAAATAALAAAAVLAACVPALRAARIQPERWLRCE
jgi:predicted permease